MTELNIWARLPLILGFPAFSKPLIAMRKSVESMESKLASIKTKIAEIEADPLLDCTVLFSYESEMDLILKQALEYRRRIVAASVKFALAKIQETYTFMSEHPESATPTRLKKLSVICRSLLKKVSAQLPKATGLEKNAFDEFSEVLAKSLQFIKDFSPNEEEGAIIHPVRAVTLSF